MLTFTSKLALPCLLVIVALVVVRNDAHPDEDLPDLSYSVLESNIWKCHLGNPSSLSELESVPKILILHHDPSRLLVYFLCSDDRSLSEWFPATAPARDCVHLGRFADLFDSRREFPAGEDVPTSLHASGRRGGLKRRSMEDSGQRECFGKYHNLTDIYSWFEDLAGRHPRLVHLVPSIGRSYFGREIMAVHITSRNREAAAKPKIYLQCLLHAREWISGPVCMYAAQALANGGSSSSAQAKLVRRLLEKVEFVIVPVANPDGYYLTWVDYPKYRFWRKNLSKLSGTSCMGVDLNRNFDVKWSQLGSSGDPCAETYHGTSAESESEVEAVVDYLKQNRPFVGAIDFHSFSQAVIYPYGYKADAPQDGGQMESVASRVAASMSKKGTKYAVHQMGSLYLASGTFGDWMFSDQFLQENHDGYGRQLQVVPLTIELRPLYDGSNYPFGFMVPADQILPTCEETLLGILNFASIVSELG